MFKTTFKNKITIISQEYNCFKNMVGLEKTPTKYGHWLKWKKEHSVEGLKCKSDTVDIRIRKSSRKWNRNKEIGNISKLHGG